MSAAALAAAVGDIAKRLLGDPNPRLSSHKELRFGGNGAADA
jgi:hypothetical protein